jgi:heme/copper-type cytochrome/quinol oxidase subunit 3
VSSELAQHSTDYSVVERESPTVLADNLRVAAQLWASATVFFFFAFLFAYFYLRSLNSQGLWRPKHVDPSLTLGTLATAAVVAAAILLRLALQNRRGENLRAWRQKGGVALGLLLLAIVLQIVEWATQGFGPTDGSYAGVYLGWTALEILFVLGLAYWVETTLATSLRYRKTADKTEFEAGEAAGDPHRGAPDIDDPLKLVLPELAAVSFYATFLAGVFVVSWVVLYLL